MDKNDFQFKRVDSYIKAVSVFIICSIVFLTIAYATSSSTSSMEGILASVKPTGDARITGVLVSSVENGGVSSSEDYNVNNIFGTVVLGSSDSTVTYKISVTVFLASEMKITSIAGLDPHLDYELTDYQIGDTLCNSNNECNYGATADIYLTIKYKDGEYNSSNSTFPFNIMFTFETVDYVARIGSTHYGSLQDAVNDVPKNNTKTTVVLVKNTSELVTVSANQNVLFDFQNNVLSNDGTQNVIINYGTVEINNGTITSDTSQGAINNESTGHLLVSGGRIVTTGTRQAIYNNGGDLEITGSAYLSSKSNQRGTVQNLNSGNILITGGTIISSGYSAIANVSNLVIGVKDGNISDSVPTIRGVVNGVNSTTNYSFYDGIIYGKNAAVNDESKIVDIEPNTSFLHRDKAFDGVNYHSIRLAEVVNVTFNPNGGNCDEVSRELEKGDVIGNLPSPTRTDYEFEGWFTEQVNGRKVTTSEVINADTELFAHWTHISEIVVAEVNGTTYNTLQGAVAAVPKNKTLTTVTLLRNTSEAVTVAYNQNILFDLQNYTISNKGSSPVITNNGTLTITNGRIYSNTTQGAINNNSNGKLTVSGGRIEATGTRQAIYNNGGSLTISDSAYLSSTSSERATVHNLNSGVVNIIGGTIVSSGLNGIENVATMTIGVKDGSVVTNTPVIQGVKYGINSTGTLNYYDGMIKGIDDTINGLIDDQEQNTIRINGSEVINGDTYLTVHLQ